MVASRDAMRESVSTLEADGTAGLQRWPSVWIVTTHLPLRPYLRSLLGYPHRTLKSLAMLVP